MTTDPAAIASPPAAMILSTTDVVHIVRAAVRSGCRTAPEQAALLRLAERVTSFMCDWEAWVRDTWESVPCEACDEVPVGRQACDTLCRRCREDDDAVYAQGAGRIA